ncbi:unnamed protein product, partial [Staurois parvus]
CHLTVPISAAYQCCLSVPSVLPTSAASSLHISGTDWHC